MRVRPELAGPPARLEEIRHERGARVGDAQLRAQLSTMSHALSGLGRGRDPGIKMPEGFQADDLVDLVLAAGAGASDPSMVHAKLVRLELLKIKGLIAE